MFFTARFAARLAAAVFACALAAPAIHAATPLPTVPALDVDRYLGVWHEIARYPNRFQEQCASDVTATYTRNADGTLGVVNACRKAGGETMRARGQARMVTPPATLAVRFAPAWLAWLPLVWGDYWVIDLADDYRYAVVGEPSREYLWVLARGPQLADADWQRIVARLPALGYDPARLVRTPAS